MSALEFMMKMKDIEKMNKDVSLLAGVTAMMNGKLLHVQLYKDLGQLLSIINKQEKPL